MAQTEKEFVNISLEGVDKKTLEIIHRHGDAEPIEIPQQLKFGGNITAPGDFFEDRYRRKLEDKKLIDTNQSHVVIDNRKLTITLFVDEKHSKRTEITGILKKNPDLDAFGIWANVKYDIQQLVMFVRKNRRFFKSKEENNKLINSLSKFKWERNQSGISADDRKGNVKELFEQSLKQDVKLEFTLNIPLFESYPAKTFVVEIIPEITDGGGIKFWFESVELIDLYDSEQKKIFDAEIKRFKDILIMYMN